MTVQLFLDDRLNMEKRIWRAINNASKHAGKGQYEEKNVRWKSDGTPVSNIDVEVEDIIRAEFKHMDNVTIIGEEGGTTNPDQDFTLYVDPIAGTNSDIRNEGLSAISVYAEFQGRPIIGIVSQHTSGIIFYAINEGARVKTPFSEKELPAPAEPLRETSLLLLGRNLEDGLRASGEFRITPHIGSIALNMAKTAAGVYDAMVVESMVDNPMLAPYDVAAGAFIMEKSGMNLYDVKGRPYDFHEPNKGLIAVREPLEETVMKTLSV